MEGLGVIKEPYPARTYIDTHTKLKIDALMPPALMGVLMLEGGGGVVIVLMMTKQLRKKSSNC